MIINSKESVVQFHNEEQDNSSSIMETLMLNPLKYREFKRDINRINNIDNEINFIKSQQMFNHTNFLKAIIISKEEYEISVKIVNDITNKISDEEITDIVSHKKLISFQKRIMEIYAYLIGYEYFDWKLFREKFSLYEAKIKMSKVDYNRIDKKKVNLFLNRLCKAKTTSLDDFPKNISSDYGMDIICEWVRNQLKIFLFLLQNNLLYRKTTTKQSNEGTVSQYKQTNSTLNSPKSLDLGFRSINLNENFQTKKKNSIVKIPIDSNKISPLSAGSNYSIENYNIASKKNSMINSHYETHRQINNDNLTNSKVGGDLLVTALPDINQQSNTSFSIKNQINVAINVKEPKDTKETKEIKENNKVEVKNSYIVLNGFDYDREHMKKEEKIIEYLPMLKYRTYHQMRMYYGIQSKINKKIEKQHFDELKMSSFGDRKNNNRILNMISNKKIGVLDNIPYFRLKQILEDS